MQGLKEQFSKITAETGGYCRCFRMMKKSKVIIDGKFCRLITAYIIAAYRSPASERPCHNCKDHDNHHHKRRWPLITFRLPVPAILPAIRQA